jgi:hypothetical protein
LLVLSHYLYKKLDLKFFEANEEEIRAAYEKCRHIRNVDAIEGFLVHALQQVGISYEMHLDVKGLRDVNIVIPDRHDPKLLINVLEATRADEEATHLIGLIDQTTVVHQRSAAVSVVLVLTGYVTERLINEVKAMGYESIDGTGPGFEQEIQKLVRSVSVGAKPLRAQQDEVIDRLIERLDRIESQARKQQQRLESELSGMANISKEVLGDIESKTSDLNKAQEYVSRIDVNALFPEKFSEIKYIGAIPKIVLFLSSVAIVVTFFGWYTMVFPDRPTADIFYILGNIFPFAIAVWLISLILFYLDWSVVGSLLDRLLTWRRQQLASGKPVYQVLRGENLILSRLSASLWVFLQRRHLNKTMYYILESEDNF